VLRFVVRRVLESIPLLLGIAVLSFIFMQLAPGGPDALFARNGRMSAEQLAVIRRSMGLNRPPHEQLLAWITNILRGDLGVSYSQFRPVSYVIAEVFPNTVILMTAGLLISLVSALVFGILAARRPYGIFDNVTSFLSYFGLAMPVFWFGLMLQLLFAVRLGWLPSAGMYSAGGGGLADLLRHLVLPALTIGIGSIAGWSRYVRSSTVEQLSQDYVRSARSKGLSERRVMTGHVLRNSLIPVVTTTAPQIAFALVGSVWIENIFRIPGIGQLFATGLGARDYPLVITSAVVLALGVMLASLLADIIYTILDPRIRLGA
jgi:peptide/nickel transport system permease protein